jgi:dolichol-phosphate mannosyltransferase
VDHHLLHRDSRGALGSVQLFVLGIFGEYLGRLAMQSQGRPLFIIEEIRGVAPLPERAS